MNKNYPPMPHLDPLRDIVLQNALDAVIAMDQDNNIIEWNTQAEKIFGWSKEDIQGRKLGELIIPPESRSAHYKGIEHFLKTGIGPILNQRIEVDALRKNNETFPVELTVMPIQIEGKFIFYSFVRDITKEREHEVERENLLIKEKTAREEAEKAILLRNEFLSIASHELKTPITSLKLKIQMLHRSLLKESSVTSNNEKASMTSSLINQINRMTKLVDNMLDISRIERGQFLLDIEDFDLREVIKKISADHLPELEASGCTLTFTHLDQAMRGWDRMRMEQVFTNLISNAIKYAPNSHVSISLSSSNDGILISVNDNGPGIPKEDIKKIFDRYERVQSSGQVTGLGLGLYITSQIIEAHHGKIWAESELGQGTTFFMSFQK
jgi:PAS domain S-box-containing protein